jgi:hypothetical protein
MTGPVVALARVVVIEIDLTRPHTVANLTQGPLADWKSRQRKVLSQKGDANPGPF